jgi:hypothetical protein
LYWLKRFGKEWDYAYFHNGQAIGIRVSHPDRRKLQASRTAALTAPKRKGWLRERDASMVELCLVLAESDDARGKISEQRRGRLEALAAQIAEEYECECDLSALPLDELEG